MTSLLSTVADPSVRASQLQALSSKLKQKDGRMYAIAFDMDTEALRAAYPNESFNMDIRKLLVRHGFTWQQGSVYFGGDTVNAVTCVLAAIDLANTYDWFATSIRDIRMLRIEELNDLMPAVEQGAR